MSLPACGTPRPFQPPVAQRDIKAEVIYCVGGVTSPLLANIALSALDDHFDRQWHQEMGSDGQRRKRRNNGHGNWKLIRYADDFVLMIYGERRHAEALREQVSAVLAPMGLRLAPEKTAVVHLDEGFTFLGFDIRRMRKRGTQKYYVYTRPSRKAIQSIGPRRRVLLSRADLTWSESRISASSA
jgi:RNA-directed DNA polymerase